MLCSLVLSYAIVSAAESLAVAQEHTKQKELEFKTTELKMRSLDLHAGDSTISLAPSQVAQAVCRQQVEPWFEPSDTKFNDVKSVGTDINPKYEVPNPPTLADTPFILSPIANRIPEKCVQAASMPTFHRVFDLAAKQGVYTFDGHVCSWLGQQNCPHANLLKPDSVGVFVRPVAGKPDPSLVAFLGENKDSCGGKFTDTDVGTLLKYPQIVLKYYQPERPYIPCYIWDGRYAQCYKVEKAVSGFVADFTRVFDLSEKDDARQFAGFFIDAKAMAFNLVGAHTVADIEIGHGATGRVYSHLTDPECVIKIPFQNMFPIITNERRIYNAINAHASPGLAHLHHDDDPAKERLMLTPRFDKLDFFENFHVSALATLIDKPDAPLRALHEVAVAVDIRPENIMKIKDSDRLAFVDLGAARLLNDQASPYNHGNVIFASDRLRAAFGTEKDVSIGIVDDLVALARCAIMLHGFRSKVGYHAKIMDLTRNRANIPKFWENLESEAFSDELLIAANNKNYEEMVKLFLSTKKKSVVAGQDGNNGEGGG
jgi:hypothetical protein